MAITDTAKAMLVYVDTNAKTRLPESGYTGRDHLERVLNSIYRSEITDTKAHRWLGFVQGVLVSYDVTTTARMREINKYSDVDG